MAIWQYELAKALPEDLAGKLPSVEQLAAELAAPRMQSSQDAADDA